ncbi:MAG: PAS domain S-box protein [Desulfobacteraceae bacterium]|nr:PAS domain S-box protein [Desulfobacteraceae bacterium]
MSGKPLYEELEKQVQELKTDLANYKHMEKSFQKDFQHFKSILKISKNRSRAYFLDHFKRATENSNDAISMSTGDGFHWYQNKAFDELFGEIGNDPPATLYADEKVGRQVFKSIMNGDSWTGEVLMNGKNKELLNIHLRAYSIQNDKGRVIGLVGVHTDITSQRRAEEAIRESEKKYRTLIETTDTGFVFVNNKGQVLDANQTYINMTGHKRLDEIIGRNVLEWTADHDIERNKLEVQKCIESGSVQNLEMDYIDKNKNITPIEILAKTIQTHEGVTIITLCRDISERKKAENDLLLAYKKLEESRENYSNLVKQAKDGIVVIQKELVQFVNPALTQMLGYDADQLKGQNFLDYVLPDYRQMVIDRYIKSIKPRDNIPGLFELKLICKSGKTMDVELSVAGFQYQNEPATMVFIKDITNRKRIEVQLRNGQKMEAVGTATGGIAHDFNNILGIIIGNTELAMEDLPEWSPVHMNLDEIKTASLRARDVVKQLLSFSRQSDHTHKLIQIHPIIKESVKLLRSTIPSSIKIRLDLSEESGTVNADPTQIHQILINLCNNAAHAMEEEGGILSISLSETDVDEKNISYYEEIKPGRYVRLTVKDTGKGIEQPMLAKIFDPYFTTKEIGKGSGMGLAVVHGIVNNHQGTIMVESQLEKGTVFTVLLPMVKGEPEGEKALINDLPIGKEHILFVDDEESLITMGTQIMEKLGYSVTAKTDPQEALALFKLDPTMFDLVITDMTMPGISGDQLIQKILELRPNTPIILCTGFSKKINQKKASQIGVRKFIEKPLVKQELARAIRQALDEEPLNPGDKSKPGLNDKIENQTN